MSRNYQLTSGGAVGLASAWLRTRLDKGESEIMFKHHAWVSLASVVLTASATALGATSGGSGTNANADQSRQTVPGQGAQPGANAELQSAQRELQNRGIYRGRIDGIPGPMTRAAVLQFQKEQGLAASGELDAQTRSALGLTGREPVAGSNASSNTTSRGDMNSAEPDSRASNADATNPGTTSPNPNPEPVASAPVALTQLSNREVRELQTSLQDAGFYHGGIDGVIGPATRTALTQFFAQQAALAQRGQLTEQGLASLIGHAQRSGSNPKAAADKAGTNAGATQNGTTSQPNPGNLPAQH